MGAADHDTQFKKKRLRVCGEPLRVDSSQHDVRCGHCQSYELDNKKYYHVEVTYNLSVAGRFWTRAERFGGIAKPAVPTVEFKNMLKKA